MKFLGFAFIVAGGWFIDCAITNRAPIGGLKTIIQNPSNLKSTLAATKGTGPGGSTSLPSGPTSTASGMSNPVPSSTSGNQVLGGTELSGS